MAVIATREQVQKFNRDAGQCVKRWLRAEHQRRRRARKRGDQIYMSKGFPFVITAEELLASLDRPKHPLLLPPFVKERR